jgi:hypothetical protein
MYLTYAIILIFSPNLLFGAHRAFRADVPGAALTTAHGAAKV